ncbi:hypothetical protein ABZY16_33045 [Streptomyces sp. NPDC006553]|uniref:hypothetical protein n=1 Tax=Streptomyces sp. NPDC006553 TaxID=3157180 RepID=UPI0033A7FE8B
MGRLFDAAARQQADLRLRLLRPQGGKEGHLGLPGATQGADFTVNVGLAVVAPPRLPPATERSRVRRQPDDLDPDPLALAGCPHQGGGSPRHSVVLGVDVPPHHPSESLARFLRNNPSEPGYPGAHTYNGPDYVGEEAGGPVWTTNVMAAVGDRTTLSITLHGMPNSRGEVGNWSTPEDIVDAFQTAAQHGAQFNSRHESHCPRRGDGTAWEMSEVAYAVRNYDGDTAWQDPEEQRSGRSWDDIHWYTRDKEDKGDGGCKEIKVPRPNILRSCRTCPDFRRT